jgi:uncharacterized protein involved in response to NO
MNRFAFFSAPHRVMFLAGTIQALLSMAWWTAILAARTAPAQLAGIQPAHLPPVWAHAVLMTYGVFPFFIFGFVMTAMPRWQGAAAVSHRTYLPAFILMALGWVLFYGGLWAAILLAPALSLVLLGWMVAVVDVWRVLRHPNPDRRHGAIVFGALTSGALGLATWEALFLGAHAQMAAVASAIGVWWLLLPVFVTVSHRMIPFFSSAVLPNYTLVRPYWALYLILTAAAVHGLLVAVQRSQWSWLVDLPAAATGFYLTVRWGLRRSFAVRLLAMLHIGFVWLGIAFALYGLDSLLLLANGVSPLGLAPLHALSIGFFATMLMAMASRVTLGHSGQALAADRITWWVFVAIQATALLRVFAELSGALWAHMSLLAALAWLTVFGIWFGKFAPAYWRARVDGRSG